MDASLIATEMLIVATLLVVSLVAIIVRRVRMPYTVALVLAGLLLAIQTRLRLQMTPELVLALFLPPLLFEAAFHIQARDLLEELPSILSLAVLGVALSTLLVGLALSLMGILPLPVALLFGALLAATDPVSVVSTFKALGAPRKLTTLLEGESLLNDGTAIVLFQIMIALVVHGTLDPWQGIFDFVRISFGGVLVGLLLGYAVAYLIGRIDDYLVETTLTTVLAYGAYLLAEHFHVSGVLAVVMAGLVNGNQGARGMSPTTRIVLYNFWEYVAFLANSLVFLLIGMNVDLGELLVNVYPIFVAIGVVLFVRAVSVYGLGLLLRLLKRNPPLSYQHVLFWGGLRGAVSLALAFSLEEYHVPYDQQLLAMTFGVVLFTLLVQGTTVRFLLQWFGLVGRSREAVEYERLQGSLLGLRAARRQIQHLFDEGALIPQAKERVCQELDTLEQDVLRRIDELLKEHPEIQAEVVKLARIEALRAARAALVHFGNEGVLSRDVVNELVARVDAALQHGSLEDWAS